MLSKINHPLIAKGHWEAIAEGSSNQLYRATIKDEHYVLRINASDELAFGVNRVREAQVLSLISSQSWAPRVIENDLQSGWCLMHDHGACVVACEETKQAMLEWMAALQLFSKQLVTEGSATKDSFAERLAEPKTVSPEHIDAVYFDHQKLFEQYRSLFKESAQRPLAIALCDQLDDAIKSLPKVQCGIIHQDLHLGNVMQSKLGSAITVIDWEYGGWGLPWLDTAALFSVFEIDKTALNNLPAYQGMDAQTFASALATAVSINQGLECIWYWIRSELAGCEKLDHQRNDKAVRMSQAETIISQLANSQ